MSISCCEAPASTEACTSSLSSAPLTTAQAADLAPRFKALADPARLRLLSLVAAHANREACVCDLADAFELTQPTISHHLKVLHDVGLLDRSKRGTWVYYAVNQEALAVLASWLDPQ